MSKEGCNQKRRITRILLVVVFLCLFATNAGLFIAEKCIESENNTESVHFTPKHWLDYPWLIAHAGGALRSKNEAITYTNSKEAFEQNYSLGHRVFEFDFYPTSDDNLALVHDWEGNGRKDGTPLSTAEWKSITQDGITNMVVEDLLELMKKYTDFYVVTDTKLADAESRREFEILYEKAKSIDITLLDRFVPQIYNHEMYDYIADIYPWKSMIYTVYQTEYSAEEVIEFSASKPEIEVVTIPIYIESYSEDVIKKAHDNGLLIFSHTPNNYYDITSEHTKGVDGFYTDYLLQDDIELLYSFD